MGASTTPAVRFFNSFSTLLYLSLLTSPRTHAYNVNMVAKSFTRACRHCGGTGRERDPSAIGREMRLLRQKSGKSLRAVGTLVGLSAVYLSDCERGNRCFTEGLIAKYREVLK